MGFSSSKPGIDTERSVLEVMADAIVDDGKAYRHIGIFDLRALIEAVQQHPRVRLVDPTQYDNSEKADVKATCLRLSECTIRAADLESLDVLLNLSIQRSAFTQRVKMDHARFFGDFRLSHIQFYDISTFVGTRFIATAEFSNVNFRNAAYFTAATFHRGVDVSGSYLRHVHMSDLRLQTWRFENALGMRFDGNDLKGVRIPPRSTEAWVTVSKAYTGTKFFVHLILLLCFVAGYAFRIAMWVAVNHAEQSLGRAINRFNDTALTVGTKNQDLSGVAGDVAAKFSFDTNLLYAGAKEYQVWQVLLGLDRGWSTVILGITLIVYNLLRAKLTHDVGVMRDEADRTDYAPCWKDYKWSWYVHTYIMRWLMLIAALSFIMHAWTWLRMSVWLPQ